MPVSVRLDSETEARIRRIARTAGKSTSWVIREAVARYAVEAAPPEPAVTLAPFIGAGDTGRADLSEQTGEQFAKLVRARARRTR